MTVSVKFYSVSALKIPYNKEARLKKGYNAGMSAEFIKYKTNICVVIPLNARANFYFLITPAANRFSETVGSL